jgi:hypothetical protein
MALPDVPKQHLLLAGSRSRLNLVHNGGFTAYPGGLGVVEDTLAMRKGGSIAAAVTRRDLIDRRLYQPVSASFAIPADAGGESILGHWDVFGGPGAVEIAPIDSVSGRVLPAVGGGNVARISFTGAGTITLSQLITDPAPLRSQALSLSYTGRSFAGQVVIDMIVLADGQELARLAQQSNTFGAYRRPQLSVSVPGTAEVIEVRLELAAGPGASVGLSGIAAFLGATGPVAPYTPSLVDLVIPSGTVVMWEGETCPAGYRSVPGSDGLQALLTGGPANFMSEDGEASFAGGQDEHDRNPAGAADTLEVPLSTDHDTDVPLPFEAQTSIHGVEFGTQSQYPGEKPVRALGVSHTHKIKSRMSAVPPCFPIRYCVKI